MAGNESVMRVKDVTLNSTRVGAVKRWPYLIAMCFLALSGFFVAKMPVRPELAFVSSLFVVIFALPSYKAVLDWLGWRPGLFLLLLLGLFAVVLESFAVLTGIPYGHFRYSERIGGLVFGLVPWTVPFAWTPLLLTAYPLAQRISRLPQGTLIVSALLLVAIDLALDPAAVGQKFWAWREPGPYFGVPWINFIGWLISGLAGSWIFQKRLESVGHSKPSMVPEAPVTLLSSGLLILSFWTSVCFWMELWLPAAIGSGLLVFVSSVLFGDARQAADEVAK